MRKLLASFKKCSFLSYNSNNVIKHYRHINIAIRALVGFTKEIEIRTLEESKGP